MRRQRRRRLQEEEGKADEKAAAASYVVRLPGSKGPVVSNRKNVSHGAASAMLSTRLGPSMSAVLDGGAITLSFENLYRMGYSLSLDGYSELVYNDVTARAKDWYSRQLAATSHIDTCLMNQRAGMVRDVLTYLDRTWVLQQGGLLGVHDAIIRAVIEQTLACVTVPQLVAAFIVSAMQERGEEQHDHVLTVIVKPSDDDQGLSIILNMVHFDAIAHVCRQIGWVQRAELVRQWIETKLGEAAVSMYEHRFRQLQLEELLERALTTADYALLVAEEAKRLTTPSMLASLLHSSLSSYSSSSNIQENLWCVYCERVLDMLIPEPSTLAGATFQDMAQHAVLKDQLLMQQERSRWLIDNFLQAMETRRGSPRLSQDESCMARVFSILPDTVNRFLLPVETNALAASCHALSYLHMNGPSDGTIQSKDAEENGDRTVLVQPKGGIWHGEPYIRVYGPAKMIRQRRQQARPVPPRVVEPTALSSVAIQGMMVDPLLGETSSERHLDMQNRSSGHASAF